MTFGVSPKVTLKVPESDFLTRNFGVTFRDFFGNSSFFVYFVVSRWPKSPFWYRDLFLGIEILHSVVQHRDRPLSGMTPCVFLGLDILYIGGQKDLDTEKKSKKSRHQKKDISIPTKRVNHFIHPPPVKIPFQGWGVYKRGVACKIPDVRPRPAELPLRGQQKGVTPISSDFFRFVILGLV